MLRTETSMPKRHGAEPIPPPGVRFGGLGGASRALAQGASRRPPRDSVATPCSTTAAISSGSLPSPTRGGVGLAADNLDMTQPALSRVISRLERQFEARLFERLPTGVRLTPFGVTVSELARPLLREFATAEERLDAARSGRTGTFRVTAGPMWTDAVMPHAAARFHKSFPGIELKIETATRAEGLQRLAGDRPTCTAAASTRASACRRSSGENVSSTSPPAS